jgi:hypothetical protein
MSARRLVLLRQIAVTANLVVASCSAPPNRSDAGVEGASCSTDKDCQSGHCNVTTCQPALFGAPSVYPVTNVSQVLIADFNRDGEPDIAVVGSSGVSMLTNQGGGKFSPEQLVAVPTPPLIYPSHAGGVGDFNGDGWPDLAMSYYFQNDRGVGVGILYNDKKGAWVPGRIQETAPNTSDLLIVMSTGDFNADGWVDFAFGCPRGVTAYFNQGNDTFQRWDVTNGPATHSLSLADFNQDGIIDVAVGLGGVEVDVMKGSRINNSLVAWGGGNFPCCWQVDGYSTVATDLNGDGKPDLAGAGDHVAVILGNGDFTFGPTSTISLGNAITSMIATDVNGDHARDLVLTVNWENDVAILLNRGDGTFMAPDRYPAGGVFQPISVAAADFNGDGRPDLAVLTDPGNAARAVRVYLHL